jgi:hypothetical protein
MSESKHEKVLAAQSTAITSLFGRKQAGRGDLGSTAPMWNETPGVHKENKLWQKVSANGQNDVSVSHLDDYRMTRNKGKARTQKPWEEA